MSVRVVTALSNVLVLLNSVCGCPVGQGCQQIANCPRRVPGERHRRLSGLSHADAWADTAPNIAGLEGWDTEKAVQLLMTGKDPSGQPPRPPMPQYRMSRGDAAAVVAYLKSLK